MAVAIPNYNLLNTTTGVTSTQVGVPYSGTISGLTSELILAGTDNINVTANIPDVFIHTGDGMDSIDVSQGGGNNILDGGGGSNFLTGHAMVAGTSAHDTFYVDDRNPTGNIWSTLVNFHIGDTATIWGVNASDFTLNWLQAQGADGFTGLTGVFSSNTVGQPVTAITLPGYGFAQLRDATLTLSYGQTADAPNAPGSSYLTIAAVGHPSAA